jgi:hypothetical protein
LDVHYLRRLLRERLEIEGEPLSYLHLLAVTLAVLAQKGRLTWSEEALSTLEKTCHAALAAPEFVDLENRSSPETGTWALKKWAEQKMLKGLK